MANRSNFHFLALAIFLLSCLPGDGWAQSVTLYYQSGNHIAPEQMGLQSSPEEKDISGATLLPSEEADIVVIYPESRSVTISGISAHSDSDTMVVLRVVPPPKPLLSFAPKEKDGDHNEDPFIWLEILPDPVFLTQCPGDSLYYMGDAALFTKAGPGAPMKFPLFPKSAKEGERRSAKTKGAKGKNTQSWVQIESVIRVNVLGRKSKVAFTRQELTLKR